MVILLRVLVRMACSSGNKFINVRSFIIFRSGEGLDSFNKNNLANFFDGKKCFWGVHFFENARKKFKLNLALVVFLDVLEVANGS